MSISARRIAAVLVLLVLGPAGTGRFDLGPAGGAGTVASSIAGPTDHGTGFVLPLPPPAVVLTPFHAPASPYGPGHRGVDLAGEAGETVRAAAAGVVVFAGPLAGRGVVSIGHPSGLRTTYEPVDPFVVAGAQVSTGDPIGSLAAGHQACVPATCLHWGARLPDGDYLDPLALLQPWRVRLLPWDQPP